MLIYHAALDTLNACAIELFDSAPADRVVELQQTELESGGIVAVNDVLTHAHVLMVFDTAIKEWGE